MPGLLQKFLVESDSKGWIISNRLENVKPYGGNTFYDVFVFQPEYVYYGK